MFRFTIALRAAVVVALLASLVAFTPARAAPDAGPMPTNARIAFLHHSTGGVVWDGGVPGWFSAYNTAHGTQYAITEQDFPVGAYPWENYPYDFWNIWVNHAGALPYSGQATLEMLTPMYDVIVFKHCFPVSSIGPDVGAADVTSSTKSIQNYKLQYAALKTALHAYPAQRFILWTGAALKAEETTPEQAARAKEFFAWVCNAWDESGDNIYVWDFFSLETDGGIYLTPAHASGDSHPNAAFAAEVAPLFGQCVVDVIEGRGDAATGVDGSPGAAGLSFALASANPANRSARFAVTLPAAAHVEIAVHDLAGRQVATLAHQDMGAGTQRFTWDAHAAGAPAGIYFASLHVGDRHLLRRFALLD